MIANLGLDLGSDDDDVGLRFDKFRASVQEQLAATQQRKQQRQQQQQQPRKGKQRRSGRMPGAEGARFTEAAVASAVRHLGRAGDAATAIGFTERAKRELKLPWKAAQKVNDATVAALVEGGKVEDAFKFIDSETSAAAELVQGGKPAFSVVAFTVVAKGLFKSLALSDSVRSVATSLQETRGFAFF